MAKQIIIPSTTPTKIGAFGVSPGKADSVIEFPEVNGTVAVINSQGIINATASYALNSPGGGGSGTSGTSGESGTSGISGDAGTSGTSGESGTSGISGDAGTSGTSGESGTSGISGDAGTSGTSGETGTAGTSGETGASGSAGTSGTSGGGGGLSGTQYIYVAANGTDTQNATELQAAYDAAKLLSPTSTNRITIVCGPGNYNFGSSSFVMDTQYIDLVSLDGNRSVIFNSANSSGTISITANDVFVKGIDVQTKNFTIASNLNLLMVENCKGGQESFGGYGTASGTFMNCIGGQDSFGGGYGGTASGTFKDCTGGVNSFGGDGGTASGTFKDCTGGVNSFGGSGGTASGTFKDCTGGSNSFGGTNGTASGTFTNCTGGNYSFGGGNSGGGTASGTFTNCQGGTHSFGGSASTLTGKLFYCRLTTGSFQTVSGNGITRLCLDGNNVENNQG